MWPLLGKMEMKMKTIVLMLATLAFLSGNAYAGKETCVTRVLNTNYNSGMEGQVSIACTDASGSGGVARDEVDEK